MTAAHNPLVDTGEHRRPVTYFGPDFPFAYDDWLKHPSGLGSVPAERHGTEVAIVGAGAAGMTAAYPSARPRRASRSPRAARR